MNAPINQKHIFYSNQSFIYAYKVLCMLFCLYRQRLLATLILLKYEIQLELRHSLASMYLYIVLIPLENDLFSAKLSRRNRTFRERQTHFHDSKFFCFLSINIYLSVLPIKKYIKEENQLFTKVKQFIVYTELIHSI